MRIRMMLGRMSLVLRRVDIIHSGEISTNPVKGMFVWFLGTLRGVRFGEPRI